MHNNSKNFLNHASSTGGDQTCSKMTAVVMGCSHDGLSERFVRGCSHGLCERESADQDWWRFFGRVKTTQNVFPTFCTLKDEKMSG